jgi:hypothetical protein
VCGGGDLYGVAEAAAQLHSAQLSWHRLGVLYKAQDLGGRTLGCPDAYQCAGPKGVTKADVVSGGGLLVDWQPSRWKADGMLPKTADVVLPLLGVLRDKPPTRLVTRTKEPNVHASQRG